MLEFIIICGGKGTRSANPALPKSLQEIDGKTLLFHQLCSLPKNTICRVILVAGFKYDLVFKHLEEIKADFPHIDFVRKFEHEPKGTALALKYGFNFVESEEVVVVLGDLYFEVDFELMMDNFKKSKFDIQLITHPNDHPADSDLVNYDHSTFRITNFLSKQTERSNNYFGNMALSGIFIGSTNILRNINLVSVDFNLDLLSRENLDILRIGIFPTFEIIKDAGTKERLDKVSELRKYKSTHKKQIFLFLDLDNTLIENVEIKNRFSEIRFSAETAKAIAKANKLLIPIFIVTNQPGIAKGFFTKMDFDDFRGKLELEFAKYGAFIDCWLVCPHHPDSGFSGEIEELKVDCKCRKPNTALAEIAIERYRLDASKCLMIGDSKSDETFAINAKFAFMNSFWSNSFHDAGISDTSEVINGILNSL